MILFVNSTEVDYEDDSSIRFFTDGQNYTLLVTSYFPNYIYKMEPYILANNNNNTRRRNRRGRRMRGNS